MIGRCECTDPGCPVCKGKCRRDAEMTLYRCDMDDETGTDFCEACASDALESGLFTAEAVLGKLFRDECPDCGGTYGRHIEPCKGGA